MAWQPCRVKASAWKGSSKLSRPLSRKHLGEKGGNRGRCRIACSMPPTSVRHQGRRPGVERRGCCGDCLMRRLVPRRGRWVSSCPVSRRAAWRSRTGHVHPALQYWLGEGPCAEGQNPWEFHRQLVGLGTATHSLCWYTVGAACAGWSAQSPRDSSPCPLASFASQGHGSRCGPLRLGHQRARSEPAARAVSGAGSVRLFAGTLRHDHPL